MEEAGAPSELSPGVCWEGLSLIRKRVPLPLEGVRGRARGGGQVLGI